MPDQFKVNNGALVRDVGDGGPDSNVYVPVLYGLLSAAERAAILARDVSDPVRQVLVSMDAMLVPALAATKNTYIMPPPSGGDDTAAIQAVWNAASAAGANLPTGMKAEVLAPGMAIYSVSGLEWKPNVRYVLQNSVFVKNQDGTTIPTNSVVRTIDVATALTGPDALTVTFATAPTPGNTAALAGPNLAVAWAGPKQYAPPVILANGDVRNVMLTPGSITTSFSAAVSATAGMTVNAQVATYYGRYDNIDVIGGIFDPAGFTCPAMILRMTNVRNFTMQGVRVLHRPTTAAWASWIGGKDVEVVGCQVLGGTVRFQDGWHATNGTRIHFRGCKSESGDDAYAFGTDSTDGTDDEGLTKVTVNGGIVNAALGSFKGYFGIPPTGFFGVLRGTVDGVTISDVVGRLGKVANGMLYCVDTATVPAIGRVNNVNTYGCHITVGSSDTTGDFVNTGTSPYAVKTNYATNCGVYGGSITVIDTQGGFTRYRLAQFANSVECGMQDVVCPALPANGGVEFLAAATTQVCEGGFLVNCDMTGGGTHHVLYNVPNVNHGIPNLRIEGNKFKNLAVSSDALFVNGVTNNTTSTITFRKNKITELAAGNGRGVVINATTILKHIWVQENDFTKLQTAMPGNFCDQTASYTCTNNLGWVTKGRGIATVLTGNSQVIVAIPATPALRMATATQASLPQIACMPVTTLTGATKWWVDVGADNQHFTINTDIVATANCTFAWQIDTGNKPV